MVVYTLDQRWEILRQIDLQKMPILANKIIFSDEAHFDIGGYVNKLNCRIWGTENPHAYIEKPKSGPFLVRILVQRHNWAIFIGKWARRGRYCQWRWLSGHVGRTIEEEDIGNIWF